MMMRTVVVVGTLLLGVGAVVAQQDLVTQAQTEMKGNARSAGAIGAMIKGDKPYDQAAVDSALTQLEGTAKKLPAIFPASVKDAKWEGDFSPSPKIWEDKAGFDAKIAAFTKAVTEAKAKVKDLDSLKANFPAIGKECVGCHEAFRIKKG